MSYIGDTSISVGSIGKYKGVYRDSIGMLIDTLIAMYKDSIGSIDACNEGKHIIYTRIGSVYMFNAIEGVYRYDGRCG